MKMSNQTYDALKWIALVGTNALSTLIITVGGLWGLDNATVKAVAGTISAIGTFLGACLQISSANYSKDSKGD